MIMFAIMTECRYTDSLLQQESNDMTTDEAIGSCYDCTFHLVITLSFPYIQNP